MEALRDSGADAVLVALLRHVVATRPHDPLRALHAELVAHRHAVDGNKKRLEQGKKALPTLPVDDVKPTPKAAATGDSGSGKADDADQWESEVSAMLGVIARRDTPAAASPPSAPASSPAASSVASPPAKPATVVSAGGVAGSVSPFNEPHRVGSFVVEGADGFLNLNGTFRFENFSFGTRNIVLSPKADAGLRNTPADSDKASEGALGATVKWEDLDLGTAEAGAIEKIASGDKFDGTVRWEEVMAVLAEGGGAPGGGGGGSDTKSPLGKKPSPLSPPLSAAGDRSADEKPLDATA